MKPTDVQIFTALSQNDPAIVLEGQPGQVASLIGTRTVGSPAITPLHPPSRMDLIDTAQGLITESFARSTQTNQQIPTLQELELSLVGLYAGETVTGLAVIVTANGTGITLAKVGLYNLAGTLLAGSPDNSANFNAGAVTRVQGTNLSAPFTVPATGAYYAAFLQVGGTGATIVRGLSQITQGVQFGTGARQTARQVGQNDLPGTAVPADNAVAFWLGVY